MAVKMPQRNGKNRISQILRFGLFWAIIIFVALIFTQHSSCVKS